MSTESKCRHNGNENPSVETTKDFDDGIEVQAASGHEMSSSQVNPHLNTVYCHPDKCLSIKDAIDFVIREAELEFLEHEFLENILYLDIP